MMCGDVATYAINVSEQMLDGLPLGEAVFELAHSSISSFLSFYGLLVAVMEKLGIDSTRLRGNGINDPYALSSFMDVRIFPLSVSWPHSTLTMDCFNTSGLARFARALKTFQIPDKGIFISFKKISVRRIRRIYKIFLKSIKKYSGRELIVPFQRRLI
jgi:hypothetical protein